MSVLSQEYVTVELLVSLGAKNAGRSMDAATSAIKRARHVVTLSDSSQTRKLSLPKTFPEAGVVTISLSFFIRSSARSLLSRLGPGDRAEQGFHF